MDMDMTGEAVPGEKGKSEGRDIGGKKRDGMGTERHTRSALYVQGVS